MGYYGLGPGMKVPDQLSGLELALRQIPVGLAPGLVFPLLEKLIKNIAQNPKEPKFRKLKLESNAKIKAAITSVRPALQALIEIGFRVSSESSDLTDLEVELAPSIFLTFPSHVNKIIDAQDWFRKETEKERVRQGLSRVAVGEAPPYAEARSQTEIDVAVRENLRWLVGGGK